MTPYVFFNRNTGTVVHTHEEVSITGESLSVPRDDLKTGALLDLLEGRVDRQDVEVMEVTENAHLLRKGFSEDAAVELYVDVTEGVLSERKRGEAGK
jgi:hypothetical protein